MRARLAIKSTRYRDKEGYLVYGTDGRGRPGQRVFAESRIAAERIRDKMKRGEEISLMDFSDCHPDCGSIVARNEESGQHCHENKHGRCWHEDGDREELLERLGVTVKEKPKGGGN